MSRPPLQAINLANQQNMAVQNNNNIPPAPPFQGFVVFLQQQQQPGPRKRRINDRRNGIKRWKTAPCSVS
ncbi:unnamed protein product [Rotaria socialis]